jgi:hypothetical protein
MPSPLPETPQELRWLQTEEMYQDHWEGETIKPQNVVALSMNNSDLS